jgi:hypothetical protein
MKNLIHKRDDTSICIYKHTEDFIEGSFFKDKPEEGDIIMSWVKREPSFLYVYIVEKIISQRDAVVSESCTHNPVNARMQLKVRNVTENIEEMGINNSVRDVL